jgi:capsular polysaccharide transport system permease protein
MLTMPLYLSSGVIFPVDRLPQEYLDWLLLNPLLHLVELSRHAFIPAYVPAPGVNASYPILFMLATCAAALLLYRADRLRLVTSA